MNTKINVLFLHNLNNESWKNLGVFEIVLRLIDIALRFFEIVLELFDIALRLFDIALRFFDIALSKQQKGQGKKPKQLIFAL